MGHSTDFLECFGLIGIMTGETVININVRKNNREDIRPMTYILPIVFPEF